MGPKKSLRSQTEEDILCIGADLGGRGAAAPASL